MLGGFAVWRPLELRPEVAITAQGGLSAGLVAGGGANVGDRLRTQVPPDTTVPIGWIAVGDPAQLFPPSEHERLWQVQRELDFPGYVFGLARATKGDTTMPELARRYSRALGHHQDDQTAGKQS